MAYDTGVHIPFPQTPIPLRFFEVPNTQADPATDCLSGGQILAGLMLTVSVGLVVAFTEIITG